MDVIKPKVLRWSFSVLKRDRVSIFCEMIMFHTAALAESMILNELLFKIYYVVIQISILVAYFFRSYLKRHQFVKIT